MTKPNEIQHGGDHYSKGVSLQHWDICATFGIGYLEGCATKYLTRWRRKNGKEDLRKAEHYLEKLIDTANDRNFEDRPRGYVPFLIVEAFLADNRITESVDATAIIGLFQWEDFEDLLKVRAAIQRMLDNASA